MKMSGANAKQRMRGKKMRNQPVSVQYPSAHVNVMDTHKNDGDNSKNEGHTPQRTGYTRDTPKNEGDRTKKEGDSPQRTGYTRDTPKNDGDKPQRAGDTPVPGHSGYDTSQQKGGWVRGHQRNGGGYAKEMPKYITAKRFAAVRAAEVNAMLKAVTKNTGSCHVFETLPKHMRRRAMSHDTKRLPCRLRDLANNMREKSNKAAAKKKKEQSKTKSRKALRRHGNLLKEFNRRQRRNMWLETHIWHAKRFHMQKKWGYCLGERPSSKCYRASYRAMSTHCLLQDLSYHCCIELQGDEDQLLAALSKLTSKEAGPTFAAALCLSGRRQGSVVVYRAGQYPCLPLGPVTFLWRPRASGSACRQLWIWAHPALKPDLLPELQNVCQCFEAEVPPAAPVATPAGWAPAVVPGSKLVKTPEAEQRPGAKRKLRSKKADEPAAKKFVGDGTRRPTTPITWRSCSTGILISDLTLEIVRYRLIGPQSHFVLTETLEAATACDAKSKSQSSSLWWPEHCKDETKMTLHRQQADLFQILKGIYSTGEIPSGTVLGLTVDDPRLTLPQKMGKAMPNIQKAQEGEEERRRDLMLGGVPEPCCQSSLWDRSVRNNVTDNMMPVKDLNRMRSELLVPGSRLGPTPQQGRVPVLLVHQPGKQTGHEMSCWGSGWDLLLPKGWGMAFWIPLVYRGVRIGGQHLSLKHSQNKGSPHFPHDYPDCPAGVRQQEEQEAELLGKFKSHPPAKRTNYIKHGNLAPFRCPWQQLAEEWDTIARDEGNAGPLERRDHQGGTGTPAALLEEVMSEGDAAETPHTSFTVMRNRKSLRLLSLWCRPTSARGQRRHRVGEVPPLDGPSTAAFLSAHRRSLVWVRLSQLSKGSPEPHALVCVPTPDDLKLLGKEPGCSGPQEPIHKDHFKSQVKCLKRGSKRAAATTSASSRKPGSTDPGSTDPGSKDSGSKDSESKDPESKDSELSSAPGLTSDPAQPSDPVSEASSAPTNVPSGSSFTPAEDPRSSSDLILGLWPDPLPSVAAHCSRVTLGWVTQGDFFLSAGCGESLGFVSVSGLLRTLLDQPVGQRGLVLTRNPTSLQYRFAKINVEV